jgi:hypothetical protein
MTEEKSADRHENRGHGGPNYRAGETGPRSNGNLGLEFTQERKDAYCKHIELTGRRAEAARHVMVSEATVSNHVKKDLNFRAQLEAAMSFFRDTLVKEAHRRAVDGTEEPVYYKGIKCGSLQRYSDTLLLALMKRHMPEFRDKIETTNTNLNADLGDMDKLTPKQRELFTQLLDSLASDSDNPTDAA